MYIKPFLCVCVYNSIIYMCVCELVKTWCIPQLRLFDRDNHDKPLDLRMPYFQTYCGKIIHLHPLCGYDSPIGWSRPAECSEPVVNTMKGSLSNNQLLSLVTFDAYQAYIYIILHLHVVSKYHSLTV